ncbi:MAG TPA: hypothetical protein VE907_06310 [Gammaproteobacteria bacterium]|nr:hypothetical protein [Gammaproteobacteria bacterium]
MAAAATTATADAVAHMRATLTKARRLNLELERRARACASLVEFARFIEIPGAATVDVDAWTEEELDDLDKPLTFRPIETAVTAHHRVMLEEIQLCMQTAGGRLMILAPPGSAKSTYASVVAPPWAMGRWPGYRVLLTSYASRLARKHGRRALHIARTERYASIFPSMPHVSSDASAAHEWSLTNASEFMAAGILAGITGNRANAAIVDDPIAGRQEAESPTIRANTWEAFKDDVESRLLPGGCLVVINTRWHQDDLSGSILPDDYDGRSGPVVCKDGRTWRVLNIPARAERSDDPVGRAVGEYLWPEWFPLAHWQALENDTTPLGQRTWTSLYQGRPTGASGRDFKREDALWYDEAELPKRLSYYGASDFAVKDPDKDKAAAGRVDFSEHGVVGMDETGDLWFIAWWSGQKETDESIDALLELAQPFKPSEWWDEGGTIDKAIRPALRRRMRERSNAKDAKGRQTSYYVKVEALVQIADKRAKCQSFAARYQGRTTHWPRSQPWAHAVIDQLVNFGAHRYDDKYDVCGLIGRGIDKMLEAPKPPPERVMGPKPFTGKWVEYQEPKSGPRYR